MEVLQKQPLAGKVELFVLVSTLINTSGFLIILIISLKQTFAILKILENLCNRICFHLQTVDNLSSMQTMNIFLCALEYGFCLCNYSCFVQQYPNNQAHGLQKMMYFSTNASYSAEIQAKIKIPG